MIRVCLTHNKCFRLVPFKTCVKCFVIYCTVCKGPLRNNDLYQELKCLFKTLLILTNFHSQEYLFRIYEYKYTGPFHFH